MACTCGAVVEVVGAPTRGGATVFGSRGKYPAAHLSSQTYSRCLEAEMMIYGLIPLWRTVAVYVL